MSGIRINMVVTPDEHPELHALLESRAPKARASVLRQHAEFGLWVKQQKAGFAVAPEAAAQPAPATPKTEISRPAPVATATAPAVQPVAPAPAPIATPAPAPVAAEQLPPARSTEHQGNTGDVLDTTVLVGVDLGDLD